MQVASETLKNGVIGAVVGALALAIGGFAFGGWVTGGTARKMAAEQSQMDVVAALSAICLDQSKRDPLLAARVVALKAESSWKRGDLVIQNGWALMPGAKEADKKVASACAEKAIL